MVLKLMKFEMVCGITPRWAFLLPSVELLEKWNSGAGGADGISTSSSKKRNKENKKCCDHRGVTDCD